MKCMLFAVLLLLSYAAISQDTSKPNIFIITIDGLRWQEIFLGADDEILNADKFVQNKELTNDLFGGPDAVSKRSKLMPFFWSTIAKRGQLYGNRTFKNKVNVKNFYKLSYPGYNELLTGYADPFLRKNTAKLNRNKNILEYLNEQPYYHNSVVAFSSWNVFPFILNEERSNFTVNGGYEQTAEAGEQFQMIDSVQAGFDTSATTRYDELTYLNTREYLAKYHPRVLFMGLGETDEFAHQGKYGEYLRHANQVDKMIADLWYFVQTDNFYKNNTIFLITTDHGRGKKDSKWYKHDILVGGSGQTWLAMIGPGIAPMGEMKNENQLYARQLPATIALLVDEEFTANHPVAKAIDLPQPAE